MDKEEKNKKSNEKSFTPEGKRRFSSDLGSFTFDRFKYRIVNGENDLFVNIWSVPLGINTDDVV